MSKVKINNGLLAEIDGLVKPEINKDLLAQIDSIGGNGDSYQKRALRKGRDFVDSQLYEYGYKTPDKATGDEKEFQDFWNEDENVRAWKTDLGVPDKSPDDPNEKYDYREAWRAGDKPKINPEDNKYHWGSVGKAKDHPTYNKQFEEANLETPETAL